jgi:hypothetical protein
MLQFMIKRSNMSSGFADARRELACQLEGYSEFRWVAAAGGGRPPLWWPLAPHQENSKLDLNRKSVDGRGHLGRIHVTASRWTETSQRTGYRPTSGVNRRPDSESEH